MISTKVDLSKLCARWSDVLSSGKYSEGSQVYTFETMVGRMYGMHSVAFNSAGTALYAVIRALGVKSVIVPNNTFYATGGMALEAGCKVTLADCSTEDFSMSLKNIQDVYSGQEAVILTHVGGTIAKDYKAIADWCGTHSVTLIEDAAHAFGVMRPYPAGSLSAAAVFSFYPTKAVPVGEGGLVVSKSTELATELRKLRNYGKHMRDGVIRYAGYGFNFRMDEWTAAVACEQVGRLTEIMELRASDVHMLSQVVKPLVNAVESNWYKFIAPASFPAKQQTGKVYQLSDQLRSIPVFRQGGGFSVQGNGGDFSVQGPREFPGSDWVDRNHICLPVGEGMYNGMSVSDVEAFLLGVSK